MDEFTRKVSEGRIVEAIEGATIDDVQVMEKIADALAEEIDQESRSRAILIYKKILYFKPDNAPAHNNLAMLLMKDGRYDEARKEYQWRR